MTGPELTLDQARELAQRWVGIEPEHDQLSKREWESLLAWVRQRMVVKLAPHEWAKLCSCRIDAVIAVAKLWEGKGWATGLPNRVGEQWVIAASRRDRDHLASVVGHELGLDASTEGTDVNGNADDTGPAYALCEASGWPT